MCCSNDNYKSNEVNVDENKNDNKSKNNQDDEDEPIPESKFNRVKTRYNGNKRKKKT